MSIHLGKNNLFNLKTAKLIQRELEEKKDDGAKEESGKPLQPEAQVDSGENNNADVTKWNDINFQLLYRQNTIVPQDAKNKLSGETFSKGTEVVVNNVLDGIDPNTTNAPHRSAAAGDDNTGDDSTGGSDDTDDNSTGGSDDIDDSSTGGSEGSSTEGHSHYWYMKNGYSEEQIDSSSQMNSDSDIEDIFDDEDEADTDSISGYQLERLHINPNSGVIVGGVFPHTTTQWLNDNNDNSSGSTGTGSNNSGNTVEPNSDSVNNDYGAYGNDKSQGYPSGSIGTDDADTGNEDDADADYADSDKLDALNGNDEYNTGDAKGDYYSNYGNDTEEDDADTGNEDDADADYVDPAKLDALNGNDEYNIGDAKGDYYSNGGFVGEGSDNAGTDDADTGNEDDADANYADPAKLDALNGNDEYNIGDAKGDYYGNGGFVGEGSDNADTEEDGVVIEEGDIVTTTTTVYNLDGSTTVTVNNPDGSVITTVTGIDGTTTKTVKNSDGTVISEIVTYPNGSSEMEIDKDGNVVKETLYTYDEDGNLVEKTLYTYDDGGNAIQYVTYDNQGNIIDTKAYGSDNNNSDWKKAGFDNEDDYNLAKALGYDGQSNEFYNRFGRVDNYIEIKDNAGNVIGRTYLNENGVPTKVVLKLPDGFTRVINPENGAYEDISPNGTVTKYEYINGKPTLVSATDNNGKNITQDVQRALEIENVIQRIINGDFGSGSSWNRDAAINALITAGANIWSLSADSINFSQAAQAFINAYNNDTLDQFLKDVLSGKYGGGYNTGSGSSNGSGGSSSSGGSGSGSGDWTGSYVQTGNGIWTDGNGNTTTVDPLSGINWGHGTNLPNGTIIGGNDTGGGNNYGGGGGSHY